MIKEMMRFKALFFAISPTNVILGFLAVCFSHFFIFILKAVCHVSLFTVLATPSQLIYQRCNQAKNPTVAFAARPCSHFRETEW